MSEQPTDEVLVEPEPVEEPALGAAGTTTTAPAPGSESDAQRAPSEALTYVERAQAALVQTMGTVPSMVDLTPEALDALTVLVLVKGDRATASDVHDSRSMVAFRADPHDPTVVPFDALEAREQQGLDALAAAVQRAGRAMGRDGS